MTWGQIFIWGSDWKSHSSGSLLILTVILCVKLIEPFLFPQSWILSLLVRQFFIIIITIPIVWKKYSWLIFFIFVIFYHFNHFLVLLWLNFCHWVWNSLVENFNFDERELTFGIRKFSQKILFCAKKYLLFENFRFESIFQYLKNQTF